MRLDKKNTVSSQYVLANTLIKLFFLVFQLASKITHSNDDCWNVLETTEGIKETYGPIFLKYFLIIKLSKR